VSSSQHEALLQAVQTSSAGSASQLDGMPVPVEVVVLPVVPPLVLLVLLELPAPLPLVVPLPAPVPPLSATMMQPLCAAMPADIVTAPNAHHIALAMISPLAFVPLERARRALARRRR
jgi:hypothetical protein